jgi:hypothetical protein
MENKESFRIVVFKEEKMFVAQCLDFDICTQASDMETLKSRMDCLIQCEMESSLESGQDLDPAPERFHNMWGNGSHTYKEVAA